MIKATQPSSTRRAVVAAAATLPVAAGVTVLQDERLVRRFTPAECVEAIASIHQNGRRVALEAVRADVDWTLIKGIELTGPNAPTLRFAQRPGSRGYPKAEIIVSMAGAFLHGPADAVQ